MHQQAKIIIIQHHIGTVLKILRAVLYLFLWFQVWNQSWPTTTHLIALRAQCSEGLFIYGSNFCPLRYQSEHDLPKLTELTKQLCQVFVSFLSTHWKPICAILKSQQTDSAPLSEWPNKNILEVSVLKHYNDFLIVGIDHGYGNIKTANTVTPTGITVSLSLILGFFQIKKIY